jgi:hypothetical protein
MEGYNGWTNRETWLVNLWFGDYFEDISMDRKVDASLIRAEIEGYIDHCKLTGFVSDLVDLNRINYEELANHYKGVAE